MRMTVLPARTFKPRRYRPGNLGTWSGHLPFASDLVVAFKPSLLVELGTHYGESYFGLCQAVQENGVSCKCYAVDTWKGDSHAGYYDESVFDEVSKYNDQNYAAFSKLLQTTFDAALESFGDGTVDLLHIDGLHTYDAIRHDFDSWFPKVRPGGVVLLHDTAARHVDFQVWKLWEQLVRQFPHFEFTHSWGLGIVRKPGGPAHESDFMAMVFSASPPEQGFLRHYYASQAEVLERAHLAAQKPASQAEPYLQVFPHQPGGYSQDTAVATTLKSGEWQHVVLELSQGAGSGRIRIDPADRPCVIRLAGVQLRRGIDGSVLASWADAAEMRAFSPIADLILLPGNDGIRFLSTGSDPQFLLPELDPELADQPLVFDAHVRIEEDLAPALALLQSEPVTQAGTITLDTAIAERDTAAIRNQQLSAEVRNLQAERVAVVADYRRVHAVNESLLNEIASLKNSLASAKERCGHLEEEAATLLRERLDLKAELQRLQLEEIEKQRLAAELNVVYQSRSWWVTAPLRRLFRAIR